MGFLRDRCLATKHRGTARSSEPGSSFRALAQFSPAASTTSERSRVRDQGRTRTGMVGRLRGTRGPWKSEVHDFVCVLSALNFASTVGLPSNMLLECCLAHVSSHRALAFDCHAHRLKFGKFLESGVWCNGGLLSLPLEVSSAPLVRKGRGTLARLCELTIWVDKEITSVAIHRLLSLCHASGK
jgi:hypothetical protein